MRLLPAAVAATVLLLSGCGGVESDPDLAAAAEKTEASGTSSFSLDVVQTDGVGGPLDVHCEGVADYGAKRMRLECGDYGTIVAIEDVYLARGLSAPLFSISPDRPWVRFPIEADDSPHDLAPGTLLTKLRAASIETERLGEEEVRGEETVRYRMTVRCSDADLECPGDTTDVEVWIDGEGLVRRATLEDAGADMTAEFFDFGRSVEVESPPESQVADLDDPALKACPGGGSPISDVQLRRALRGQGFEVKDDDGERCFLGVVGTVAGILNSAADAADSGFVICYVYAADPGAPARVEQSSSSGVVGLRLRNVGCSTLESRSEAPAVVRLRAALEEFER